MTKLILSALFLALLVAGSVRAETRAETLREGDGLCGDYPHNWCVERPNARIRIAGKRFLNRECTAYVAYKRSQKGKPFATGNAGDWPGSSHKPTVGSVAIWNHGTVSRYGHVAYVTAVSAESITVSEFNFNAGKGPFHYHRRTIKREGRGWPSRFWN